MQGYEYIVITARHYNGVNGGGLFKYNIFKVDNSDNAVLVTLSNTDCDQYTLRTVSIEQDGVTFGASKITSKNDGHIQTSVNYCIPYQIYGIAKGTSSGGGTIERGSFICNSGSDYSPLVELGFKPRAIELYFTLQNHIWAIDYDVKNNSTRHYYNNQYVNYDNADGYLKTSIIVEGTAFKFKNEHFGTTQTTVYYVAVK